jgi:hypothetical protein
MGDKIVNHHNNYIQKERGRKGNCTIFSSNVTLYGVAILDAGFWRLH